MVKPFPTEEDSCLVTKWGNIIVLWFWEFRIFGSRSATANPLRKIFWLRNRHVMGEAKKPRWVDWRSARNVRECTEDCWQTEARLVRMVTVLENFCVIILFSRRSEACRLVKNRDCRSWIFFLDFFHYFLFIFNFVFVFFYFHWWWCSPLVGETIGRKCALLETSYEIRTCALNLLPILLLNPSVGDNNVNANYRFDWLLPSAK